MRFSSRLQTRLPVIYLILAPVLNNVSLGEFTTRDILILVSVHHYPAVVMHPPLKSRLTPICDIQATRFNGSTPGRELPPYNTSRRIRTAYEPKSTGLELATHQEALQHRFLAYTFPSRSPNPTHPAVLDRSDFVAAAPTLPGDPRIRLPPASPDR